MTIKWWKIISNPFFSFVLCILALIAFFGNSLFLSFVCTISSIISFIISIIKSDKFSIRPIVISLLLIISVLIISFFSILMGYLALVLLFCIWVFCIIFSIFSIIITMKENKNHILNYIFLFSLFASLIGSICADIKVDYNEKELLKIANKIDNYYENTNNKFNYNEIKNLLEGYKKLYLYKIDIEDNFYTISISLRLAGGIRSIEYLSKDKKIHKEYLK